MTKRNQLPATIWNFYYDAKKLFQADNCIIITRNWMTWWSLNDLPVCLVSALGWKTPLVAGLSAGFRSRGEPKPQEGHIF